MALDDLDTSNVDIKYLYRFLQKRGFRDVISGSSQPQITGRSISTVRVPLPPLDEQRRIAAILDQADALRRKRREALDRTQNLRTAVYVALFGDPGQNPCGWPIQKISDVSQSSQYGSSEKAGSAGGYPMLRMGNLTSDGRWKLDDMKYIDLSDRDRQKFTVRKGDILFNRTNSPDLVGKTAVFQEDKPYAFAGYLIRLRLIESASAEYVSAYLNSKHGKATLRGMCKSIIGMANINAKELASIRLPMPPIDLQNRYATVVQVIRDEEAKQRAHLKVLDGLFSALQQRAFAGEL